MKNNRKILKLLITLVWVLTLLAITLPAAKYFAIATVSQNVKLNQLKKEPDYEQIPSPQPIQAPRIQDILNKQEKGENFTNSSLLQAIGQIVIPDVSVNQPILEGLTSYNMVHGTVNLFPQRNPESQSLTVVGHHVLFYNWGDWLLFGGIEKLRSGDEIYIRYLDKYYEYEVESKSIIRDTDINKVADQGPDYIFLITCTESVETPYRVLVTGKKVAEKTEVAIKKEFEQFKQQTESSSKRNYFLVFVLPIILIVSLSTFFLRAVWRM